MTRARLPGNLDLRALMGLHGLLRADPPEDEKARAEEFRVLAQAEAAAYTIQVEGRSRPLTLQPEPVLKWSNPVVGTIYGDVFVWTDEGRPEVVASIYKWYSPRSTGPTSSIRWRWARWRRARRSRGLDLLAARSGAEADRGCRRAGRLGRHCGSARCARWRRSSPAGRPTARGWTATCACWRSRFIATRTRGRPDRRRSVRLCAGNRPRGLSADRSSPAGGRRSAVAIRRGPDEQHQSPHQPSRSRGLERAGAPLVASVGPQRAVHFLPV